MMTATGQTFDIFDEDLGEGVIRCAVRGDLDAFSVSQFRARIGAFEGSSVVFDLADVPFIDSVGLGGLVGAIRRVRAAGGSVAVAAPRFTTRRLLHVTGLERIAPLAETVEAARRLL